MSVWQPCASRLHGCCATTYKQSKSAGGYSDFRINENTFAITFRGNAATFEETIELYLLRRAADLTLEHGFDYFVILSEHGRTRKGSIGYSGLRIPIVAPGASMHIRCFHEPPDTDDTVICAAKFLDFNFPSER